MKTAEKIINKKGIIHRYAVKEISNCKPYKKVFKMVEIPSSCVSLK
jgi:hypothetical protein